MEPERYRSSINELGHDAHSHESQSTLLKLLTGEIQPTKGEVKRNPRLRYVYWRDRNRTSADNILFLV